MSKKLNTVMDLLVHGYIHEVERDTELTLIIPQEIYNVIALFYPRLLKFELFDSDRFELLDDGYEIKGKPRMGCSGYTVYPECLVNDGYKKGTHYWSVKLLGEDNNALDYCFHSIGIIANQRNQKWCSTYSDKWPIRDGFEEQPSTQISWYKGDLDGNWNRNHIMTVKLDCDHGIVEYWNNEEKVQKDKIDTDQSYYFAMNTCCIPCHYFKVVDTPSFIPL